MIITIRQKVFDGITELSRAYETPSDLSEDSILELFKLWREWPGNEKQDIDYYLITVHEAKPIKVIEIIEE